MRPSRRLLATPIVLTTVLTLAACGDESPDARGSEPIDTTETTVPDATPQPLTIGSLGDDDLVFRLGLSGSNGGDDPSLVSVYANGNVIVSSDSKPLGFATFRVGDAALDELLGLATAARPFGDVDYGEPEVTDVGSTVVTVHVDRGSTTVSAWALGFDTDELDPQQTEARRRLDALAGALAGLADGGDRLSDVTPYQPLLVNVFLSAPNYDSAEDGVDTPWPLSRPLHRQRLYENPGLCFQVAGGDVALVTSSEDDEEQYWSLPPSTPVAAPSIVRVTAAAALPDTPPCDGAEREPPVRALTDEEQDESPHDWENPWPADRRTTTMSLEVWMAHEAMVTQVLPRREGWPPDGWTRWGWFEVRYIGVDVDGRRYLDVFAECNPYVTDEEPACTIRARFDVATQRLVEFEAS